MSSLPSFPPINTLPLGILSFLGIKNGGRYPDIFRNELLPQMEMSPWYFATRTEVLTATTTANAPGSWFFGTTFDVPNGQLWIVTDCAVYSNALIASEAAQISLVVDYPTSGNVPCFVGDPGVRSVAAGHRPGASKNREFLWLPPTARLGFFAHECTTAGSITFQGNLRFVRVQI